MAVYNKSISDILVTCISYSFVVLALIVCAYPFIYIFSMSVSDPGSVARGEVFLYPRGFSLEGYKGVFSDNTIWMYYKNSIWYTVVGTVLSIFVTTLAAYPLSRADFVYRKFFMYLIVFTMFFSGGLIPLFILIVKLGLYDTRWALVLPTLVSAFNLIICRTYMQTISDEIVSAARIDGCSEMRLYFNIILPLSKPIIAVLAIFYGIGYWNMFFNALVFLKSSDLHPIQIFLRRVLIQSSPEVMMSVAASTTSQNVMSNVQIKYVITMVVVLPILGIYPFFQKYFVKGVMIGSIKG